MDKTELEADAVVEALGKLFTNNKNKKLFEPTMEVVRAVLERGHRHKPDILKELEDILPNVQIAVTDKDKLTMLASFCMTYPIHVQIDTSYANHPRIRPLISMVKRLYLASYSPLLPPNSK